MKNNHVNLSEAMKINHDLLVQKSIVMHYDVYVLNLNFSNNPMKKIKSLIMHNDLKPLDCTTLKVGGFILI